MLRSKIKRNGYYPSISDGQNVTKKQIHIGNSQSFLLVSYETSRKIDIYIGGPDKWCINCELVKDANNEVKQQGYLIKARYDMLCSLEHSFAKGKDTRQLILFLIQYINNNYKSVKGLQFNDLSTRSCDNDVHVNLAVMTYLYSNKTWYQKNFGAFISPQNKEEFNKIIQKYNYSKKIAWDIMKETIANCEESGSSDDELEQLYNDANTWKEFFEPIYNKLEIADFCIFISNFIDKFIIKYFNNLQGLTFIIPIRDYNIKYTENKHNRGGRRYTQKKSLHIAKDYK